MTWAVSHVDKLDATMIRGVLDNEIAAVHLPGYLDEHGCRRSVEALSGVNEWSFYEGATPALGRLGITQYEHFGAMEEYLSKAGPQLAVRRRILAGLPDPQEMLMADLGSVWPAEVRLAEDAGRLYFAGVFRRGAAGTIHADWAPRDAPGWTIGSIQAQLGWNVYYQVPANGGQLVVFWQPWNESLERHARQRFNDYDPVAFEGVPRVTLDLTPGDLVIFNARNMHEVTPSPEGDQRVSVGSFIGELSDGDLVFWS